MSAPKYHPTTAAFMDADHAWSDELRRLFGKRAGDVRYTAEGKGAEGSELRRLHDAREAARIEWENMLKAETEKRRAAVDPAQIFRAYPFITHRS